MMTRLTDEIERDVEFIKSHQLQPAWYKVFKVLLVLSFLGAYGIFFGLRKVLVFLAVFLILSLGVHLLYRAKSCRWTKSWLDFRVEIVDGVPVPTHIGAFYYTAVACNAALAILISQFFG